MVIRVGASEVITLNAGQKMLLVLIGTLTGLEARVGCQCMA